MNAHRVQRTALMVSSAIDSLLGAIALLVFFGVLPFDISGWGIPRWIIGAVGAVLFFSGIAIFAYASIKSDEAQ